jgi:hypothetical protein
LTAPPNKARNRTRIPPATDKRRLIAKWSRKQERIPPHTGNGKGNEEEENEDVIIDHR